MCGRLLRERRAVQLQPKMATVSRPLPNVSTLLTKLSDILCKIRTLHFTDANN